MKKTTHSPLFKISLFALAPLYRKVILFGFFTNFLVLAPSWYMLEVYDRVINSRNTITLLMLTMMVVFLYLVMELLEWVRKKMLYAAARQVDEALNQHVFNAAFLAKVKTVYFPVNQAFADFKVIKESLYSSALMGLIDIPYTLIFITAIFLIHPSLGILTLIGLAIQIAIAFFNQSRIHPQMQEANGHALAAQQYFAGMTKRAEVIQAMGMLNPIKQKWLAMQHAFLFHQAQASEVAGKSAAISRLLQTMQSALILGLACYLEINNQLENGGAMMIVASILAARVLSPVVQLVTQWQVLMNAQDAYQRLKALLEQYQTHQVGMQLPPPTGELTVENVSFATPNTEKSDHLQGNVTSPNLARPNVTRPSVTRQVTGELFLKNIQCKLMPGQVLIVAGPSASGKTTLSKLLVGLHAPTAGKVRFNGVDAHQWPKESLGQHLGYLPQAIALMDGTIAENIARFGDVDVEKLHTAMQLLGLESFINALPEGIHTHIGQEGEFLSGGRRQLIGLARAIYGHPKIVVLDEPNANLDEVGEAALLNMVKTLKAQGTTFVIISHIQSISVVADYLMILVGGQMVRYGSPNEVMASLNQPKSVPNIQKNAAQNDAVMPA